LSKPANDHEAQDPVEVEKPDHLDGQARKALRTDEMGSTSKNCKTQRRSNYRRQRSPKTEGLASSSSASKPLQSENGSDTEYSIVKVEQIEVRDTNGYATTIQNNRTQMSNRDGGTSRVMAQAVMAEPGQTYVSESAYQEFHRQGPSKERKYETKFQKQLTGQRYSHHAPPKGEQVHGAQSYQHEILSPEQTFKFYDEHEINSLFQERQQLDNECANQKLEIEKLKTQVNKLQVDRLSNVDRFQPAADATIKREYDRINLNVYSFANAISKLESKTLRGNEWVSRVMSLSWKECYNDSIQTFGELKIRDCRKMLMGMIWKFLYDKLFIRPFLSFSGHEQGETLDAIYTTLFHNPCELPRPH
jgi:hypothetical protein